jgi:hypothetical protein
MTSVSSMSIPLILEIEVSLAADSAWTHLEVRKLATFFSHSIPVRESLKNPRRGLDVA